MKILVCVKVIKGELNPFDESAIECALRLSDDITVISMGPMSICEVLKPLTRLGVKVILISDPVYAGSDTLATSYILGTAIKQMDYDLILCGRQSIDGDTAQVGPMLSAMLGCSLSTNAMSVEICDGRAEVTTRSGTENVNLPALVTMERSYVLRFPSIFSKAGDVSIINNASLGCDEKRCGLQGSPTRVLETHESERGRRKCKFISFDELKPLIDELMAKSDKRISTSYNGAKLQSVWAIGDKVLSKAREIAHEVILIEEGNPAEIAQKAMEEKPSAILWNADLWGRKNAPIVAAMLNTGLCADCTSLETDGEILYMYRPAQGGNIIAKIKCVTKPQMATVRTKTNTSDIIVSVGKGAYKSLDKAKELALSLDAELGASRGLVDMDGAPYDMQIGLTGKSVSPKVYIAIGISGAIHHTCAIEGAETVIAINPDKDARIFDYADYGIVEEYI